jgi:hypothetical protein
MRAMYVPDHGYPFAFRRDGAIYAGWLDMGRTAKGGITRISGAGAPAGSPVGSPAIAYNRRELAVAFADRAAKDEPWTIRVGRAQMGSVPTTTAAFTLPSGGPGAPAIAPAIAGLADGRWLLVWTEGSGKNHDVRAQTLDPELRPVGDPIAISRPGSNAGQGAVAIEKGKGIVAFLAPAGKGYDLWSTSLDCP